MLRGSLFCVETQMTKVNKNRTMCSAGGTVKYNVKATQRNLRLKSMKSQEKVTLTVFIHAELNTAEQWRLYQNIVKYSYQSNLK